MVVIPQSALVKGYQQGPSKPYRAPVGLGAVIGEGPNDTGPSAVRFDIDWSQYGITAALPYALIEINLAQQAVQQPLNVIRSVYVDNSEGYTSVYVLFPDTQYVVVCPPHSIVWLPVITGGAIARIYSEGFFFSLLPTCRVHFTNIPVEGFLVTFPVSSVNAFYIGGGVNQPGGLTTFAIIIPNGANAPIGPTRNIVLALVVRTPAAAPALVTAQINGVGSTMTLINTQTINTGVVGRITLAFYRLLFPTGVITSITVDTGAAACNDAAGAVWALYNGAEPSYLDAQALCNLSPAIGIVSSSPFVTMGGYCALATVGYSAGAPVSQNWRNAGPLGQYNVGSLQFSVAEINGGADDFISVTAQSSLMSSLVAWN